MKVQPVIANNANLNNLFLKNKFISDVDGSVSKVLSIKDKLMLNIKMGRHSSLIQDIFEKRFGKDQQDAFNGFLSVINDNNFISKHFSGLFAMFSILNKNSQFYKDANMIISDNKGLAELYKNVIAHPPQKAFLFDAIRRYKGVDCGKINRTLRGQNEYIEPRINKEIKHISKYINTQIIKTPVTLYRSEGMNVLSNVNLENGKTVNLEEMLNNACFKKDKIDFINKMLKQENAFITQKGFMSTSTSDRICQNFGHESFYWQLNTAPNTKAAFIEPLMISSCMDDEKEVLLQHGSKIKINEVIFNDKLSKWCLKGEVSN